MARENQIAWRQRLQARSGKKQPHSPVQQTPTVPPRNPAKQAATGRSLAEQLGLNVAPPQKPITIIIKDTPKQRSATQGTAIKQKPKPAIPEQQQQQQQQLPSTEQHGIDKLSELFNIP